MKASIIIKGSGTYKVCQWSPGDTVKGHVKIESSSDQIVSAINLNFVGRLNVEIRSRNPTVNNVNVAQHTFFRHTHTLWEGNERARSLTGYMFEVRFPDDSTLLPSYSDSENQKLMKNTGKGTVEYYVEAQILAPNASQVAARHLLGFVQYRYVTRPAATPSKLHMQFACQSPKLAIQNKSSFRDRFRSSSSPSPKDPIVHFLFNFVHSTEAILGQTLHLFVDLAPDPDRTTALTVPPVYLKALKMDLVSDHTLSTSYFVEEQNGVPTKWRYKRQIEVMKWKAYDDAAMILLYDKCDLRPHFKDLRLPWGIHPTITHENLTVQYRFEISAELVCLGKIIRPEAGLCEPITLLPYRLTPALTVDERTAISQMNSADGGTFTDEDVCPVCQKTLPPYPESARQGHLDTCLSAATSVNIPHRPKSVLVVDDYLDFTSPITVAYMAHMRRLNEQFAKCIGRVVWAEHDQYDVLEVPASVDALQTLLSGRGISYSRLPSHRYWESEELNSYDYILYAGQRAHAAQRFLDNAAPAFDVMPGQDIGDAPLKRATLINMANLIPRHKWPHDARDLETAWTKESNSEVRLNRQFEVIKDCVLELAWQLFSLALPGFDKAAHPDRVEAPGHIPVELFVPPPLPPELPSFVEPQELPAEPLSARRVSEISQRSFQSHRSNEPDADLYADPRRSSTRQSLNGFLSPTTSRDGNSWHSGPVEAYETPKGDIPTQSTIQRKPVGLAKTPASSVTGIGVEGYG